MPFTVISGTFHLLGRSKAGKETGFEPDGDSIQFRPNDPALLNKLERAGSSYRLTSIGSTQLRLEGMDALELHFDGRCHQPRPAADQARDYLTGLLGLNPVPYAAPDLVRVKPPIPKDGAVGYILSRSLEVHGRPISFAFAGAAPTPDGEERRLSASDVKESLNYKSVASGNAYPLFYDTLFRDLREAFSQAADAAAQKNVGVWAADRSQSGLQVIDEATLELNGNVFPKLFRRLVSYFKVGGQPSAQGFVSWLATTKEQVMDLTSNNFTHFDNLVAATNNEVRMTVAADQVVFISAKTPSRTVAPWLRH